MAAKKSARKKTLDTLDEKSAGHLAVLRAMRRANTEMARTREIIAVEGELHDRPRLYGGYSTGGEGTRPTRLRINWEDKDERERFEMVREAANFNWYARLVLGMREAFFGHGFRWGGDEKAKRRRKKLMSKPAFAQWPWERFISDLWSEFCQMENVVLLWKRNVPEGENASELPPINVLRCEQVKYQPALSFERILVKFDKDTKLPPEADEVLGAKVADAIRTGTEWDSAKDPAYDFAVLTSGKRGHGFRPPALLSVVDDLEFLEMIKVGDFNASKMRKDIIRHTKRGYAITSGPAAGTNLQHLTAPQKKLILENYKQKVRGDSNVVTNFDVAIDYVLMDPGFFGDDVTKSVMRRLAAWGGFAAVMLRDGFSQVQGVSPYATQALRAEAGRARGLVRALVEDVFSRRSFLGMHHDDAAGALIPAWSQHVLYSSEELIKLATFLHISGTAAPQWIREELFDLDSDEQSALMKLAHKDRKGVSPPWESRQNLLPAIFQDELMPKEPPGTRAAGDKGDGGDPGEI